MRAYVQPKLRDVKINYKLSTPDRPQQTRAAYR